MNKTNEKRLKQLFDRIKKGRIVDKDIWWNPKMFWGSYHHQRIKHAINTYTPYKIIEGENSHVKIHPIFLKNSDKIYEVTFDYHDKGDCIECEIKIKDLQ